MVTAHIAGRPIGLDHPPFIVAELSANHNGSLQRALASIDAAARAGADAVKLQTYTPDTITLDCRTEAFTIRGGLWDGESLYQLYQRAHTPFEWHAPLFERARVAGIPIFSSPFDATAVDLLESLDAPAYKIASCELVDLPLIRRVAATGKPIILSSGMAGLVEIAEALEAARAAGAADLILLHCVSGYPTPADQANLRTIPDLAARFGVPVGLSDHSLGTAVPVAATALGAVLIEKHFMLDDEEDSPDSAFSLTEPELARLVADTRTAWSALGAADYQVKPAEQETLRFRRSLYVVRDLAAGERLGPDSVRSIRPGFGLAPKHYEAVLGRAVVRAVSRGTPVTWDLLEPGQPPADTSST
ncbi:MAG: pseudaminic acid synthase [Rhodothalassiaceae bacterium]